MKSRTMRRAVLQVTRLRLTMNPVSIGSGPNRTWQEGAAAADGVDLNAAADRSTQAAINTAMATRAFLGITGPPLSHRRALTARAVCG